MNPVVLVVVLVLETKSTGRGRGRRRGGKGGSWKAPGRRPALQSPDSWSSRAPSFERLSGRRSVTAGTHRVAARVSRSAPLDPPKVSRKRRWQMSPAAVSGEPTSSPRLTSDRKRNRQNAPRRRRRG